MIYFAGLEVRVCMSKEVFKIFFLKVRFTFRRKSWWPPTVEEGKEEKRK